MKNLAKLAVAAATASLMFASSTPALAAGRLVRASHADPFAGCAIGAADGSVVYPGAEVEPSVTTDHRRPRRVVGVWQQDRWSDGGAKGLVAAYSTNGGRSFGNVIWPVSQCAPGGLNYERATDPWVSTGPDGIVYGSALSFDANTPRNAVVAITSYDGGQTWQNIKPVIEDTQVEFFNDKNSVTADPVRPGTAYQVWDRLVVPTDNPAGLVTGPTWMSVTRDGGRTWSRAAIIVDTAPYEQTIGNVIVADPRTGVLHNFYTAIQFTDVTATQVASIRFEVVHSSDAGRTWSKPSVVAPDTSVQVVHPITQDPVRTAAGLPSPAIDRKTGTLYVAYEGTDFTAGAYNQIQLVRSNDGGRTWSAPTRVSRDFGVPAFLPSIAVTADGDVGVTYYDLRTLRSTDVDRMPTTTWLTVSGRGGQSFDRERRTARVFDLFKAPFAGGYFVGDYQGLTSVDDVFRALFVTTADSQPGNLTDAYYGQFHSLAVPAAAVTTPAFGATRSQPAAPARSRLRR